MMSRISLVLLSLQILGCLGKSIEVPQNYDAMRTVVGGINQFSSEFYEAVAKSQEGNLILSPFSACTVLSMLTEGAHGNTETELKKALHIDADEAVQKRGMKTLIETLNEFTKVDLKVANNIFIDETITIKKDFKTVAESVYKSAAESINFADSDKATETVNKWASDHTNAKIQELFAPGTLTADNVMVLVNAVYFKGDWRQQFDASLTKNETFNLADGTKKEVEMMHVQGDFRYGTLDSVDATFVELPYESNDMSDDISMFIILPNESTNLKNVLNKASKISFLQLMTGLTADVKLSLPKFKIDSELELITPLKGLGIDTIFTDGSDLSGLADGAPLKVSKIIQKAVIEVNEQGSEAAAATGAGLENRFSWSEEKQEVEFIVNRPFLAAIATQDVILFVASIHVPEY